MFDSLNLRMGWSSLLFPWGVFTKRCQIVTGGGPQLYFRVVTLKRTPSAILTWSSTMCLGFWFRFRRYQHMQHNVEQHRCHFWINNQPLMALQEVNSLISARLQTQSRMLGCFPSSCAPLPSSAATCFLFTRLHQLARGRLTLQRDSCTNICNQWHLIVPDDLHFGRRSLWSNYFPRSLVSFNQTLCRVSPTMHCSCLRAHLQIEERQEELWLITIWFCSPWFII